MAGASERGWPTPQEEAHAVKWLQGKSEELNDKSVACRYNSYVCKRPPMRQRACQPIPPRLAVGFPVGDHRGLQQDASPPRPKTPPIQCYNTLWTRRWCFMMPGLLTMVMFPHILRPEYRKKHFPWEMDRYRSHSSHAFRDPGNPAGTLSLWGLLRSGMA